MIPCDECPNPSLCSSQNACPWMKLRERVEDKIERGDAVTGVSTAFPKNPPPPGIAYSKNFARFHRDGIFAIQVRD